MTAASKLNPVVALDGRSLVASATQAGLATYSAFTTTVVKAEPSPSSGPNDPPSQAKIKHPEPALRVSPELIALIKRQNQDRLNLDEPKPLVSLLGRAAKDVAASPELAALVARQGLPDPEIVQRYGLGKVAKRPTAAELAATPELLAHMKQRGQL